MEHENLQRLFEVRGTRRFVRLFNRRGADGRDQLPSHLQAHPQRAGPEDRAGCAGHHRHYRHGGHWNQPVLGEGGHGYLGQAHRAG